MEPYLHGSLNNPSKDVPVRSQAAPVHNMLSEQPLVLSITMFGMHLTFIYIYNYIYIYI